MTDAVSKPTSLELRELLFFARYVARKHVKAEWKAQGIRIYDWAPRDLSIAAAPTSLPWLPTLWQVFCCQNHHDRYHYLKRKAEGVRG